MTELTTADRFQVVMSWGFTPAQALVRLIDAGEDSQAAQAEYRRLAAEDCDDNGCYCGKGAQCAWLIKANAEEEADPVDLQDEAAGVFIY